MCETGLVNSGEAHADITLKLLEEVLWSDRWRGLVRREITKHALSRKETFLKARLTASWRTTLSGPLRSRQNAVDSLWQEIKSMEDRAQL